MDQQSETTAALNDIAELASSLIASGVEREAAFLFIVRWVVLLLVDPQAAPDVTDHLKARWIPSPDSFAPGIREYWRSPMMQEGQFSGLAFVPELSPDQFTLLLRLTDRDWTQVDTLIIGSIVNLSMAKEARGKLGAFYTPREYIMRVVRPTMEEPLRDDFRAVQEDADALLKDAKLDGALLAVRDFHAKLCKQRVLDPSCGAGNFLVVALDVLKGIELDVISYYKGIGGDAGDLSNVTVGSDQLYGIDIDPVACEGAKLSIRVAELRWARHFARPAEPSFCAHIENRDALLAEAVPASAA